jgi:hypothetical protein
MHSTIDLYSRQIVYLKAFDEKRLKENRWYVFVKGRQLGDFVNFDEAVDSYSIDVNAMYTLYS